MKSYLKHYIDGAWVDSEGGTRHEVIDPSTEQPVSEIMLGIEGRCRQGGRRGEEGVRDLFADHRRRPHRAARADHRGI